MCLECQSHIECIHNKGNKMYEYKAKVVKIVDGNTVDVTLEEAGVL
jgi:hypothetical protein